MENGHVILPIEKYNAMRDRIIKLEAGIKVKKNWNGQPTVELLMENYSDIITDKFNKSTFTETHDLVNLDEHYNPTCDCFIRKDDPLVLTED